MKSVTSSSGATKLKFVGIYTFSIVLLLFILFPFLEGNSANFSQKQQNVVLPVQNNHTENQSLNESLQKSLAEAQDSLAAYKKSLTQFQNDLEEREQRITTLQNRVNELQQRTTANVPVQAARENTVENERLKARVAALEKKNATLIDLNNDLKRNNEFLTAQVNSLKGK